MTLYNRNIQKIIQLTTQNYKTTVLHILVVTDWLATERQILLFYFFFAIDWSYEERERREERKEEDG